MKTKYTAALAVVAGFGLGAVTVESLHAQAKPLAYYIAEVDVTNQQGYMKEYLPKVQATTKAASGRVLAAGGKVVVFEGAPPKPRVALQVWDSMEKLQAWRNSKEYKENRKIGDKYATFRSYAVEGVSQ